MTERVDCVVIGAGVVGLPVTRALALADVPPLSAWRPREGLASRVRALAPLLVALCAYGRVYFFAHHVVDVVAGDVAREADVAEAIAQANDRAPLPIAVANLLGGIGMSARLRSGEEGARGSA